MSAAAIAVLADYFGEKTSFIVDSNAVPAVTRYFADFQSALDEIVTARVWSGIHFRSADVDVVHFGTAVGRYIIDHALRPR